MVSCWRGEGGEGVVGCGNLCARVACGCNMIACNLCGAEAVPKRILELMGVHGLTRENVASHLQVRYPGIRYWSTCRIRRGRSLRECAVYLASDVRVVLNVANGWKACVDVYDVVVHARVVEYAIVSSLLWKSRKANGF